MKRTTYIIGALAGIGILALFQSAQGLDEEGMSDVFADFYNLSPGSGDEDADADGQTKDKHGRIPVGD